MPHMEDVQGICHYVAGNVSHKACKKDNEKKKVDKKVYMETKWEEEKKN
jgi:hypothetical protein